MSKLTDRDIFKDQNRHFINQGTKTKLKYYLEDQGSVW